MKFIFPKNYNFKNKLFGIIDYSSLFVNLLWEVFVFCFINLIFVNITIKIFIFIVLCLPLFLFSLVGLNNENILYVINYLIKFVFSTKIFLFNKDH
jgi:hypothetical protein